MNTTQLECFLEVANCLNFSRAAQRLNITQHAVSHQINTLENELGVKLFQRTSKSVRLTQEGHVFIEYAGEILKLSRISINRMRESDRNAPRRLIIGCRNTLELRLLIPALDRFRTIQPEILPAPRLIPFDAMENLLADGSIHLAFAFQRASIAKARYQELCRCQVMCVCAPSHPLAGAGNVTMEALRTTGHIAVYRPPACPPDLFAIQTQAMGVRHPGQILFCDNLETIFPLVAAGYGFALLPDYPNARLPDLCYRPIDGLAPLSFGAVYLPQKKGSAIPALLSLLTPPDKMSSLPG